MLFVRGRSVDTILSMSEIMDAVEDALREMASGRGVDLPRRRIHHPNRMIFGVLPGSFQGVMGAYLQTDLDRRMHHETIILYSVESGEPLILFQDCSINELRTGAAGGMGAKYLARRDAGTVAVLGSAVHAKTQLRAVCSIRPIRAARVFSPSPEHRLAFAREMGRALQLDVRPAQSADEAIEGVDIVIVATNSQSPVFDGKRLAKGMHVTSIANGDKKRIRREVDETALRRSDRIFITSKETVCHNESDIFRAVRDGLLSWDRVHEIGDLILGKGPGRAGADEITLYKLQGLGIMDMAVALRAYERLKGESAVPDL